MDAYLARAHVDAVTRPLRAIVAPHAGLMYSGQVAAYAYDLVRSSRCTSIVLVGPSHFVPFDGVSIWPDGAWDTPLGPVSVDRELAQAIMSINAVKAAAA